MRRFSRHVCWLALCAAFCPAAVRAQSAAYYVSQDPTDPGAVAPEPMLASGPASGACQNGCCCDSCCGGGLFGGCGLFWPCGCKLFDLGEARKVWETCCGENQGALNGWVDQSVV